MPIIIIIRCLSIRRLITPIFPDVIPVVVEDSQSSDEEARDYHHLSVPEDAWDAESCRVSSCW